ncbi:MAG: formate dehydrogenase accessory protein FdhE, partial [Bacteroidota bacterium]|nr:formate dehydrogenase accessory protein FdhE [Bacteroidota bacterium]
MEIEEIIKEKPHLQSLLELYEKTRNFVNQCKEDKETIKFDSDIELIDIVLRNFSSFFNIPYESIAFLKNEVLTAGIDPIKDPRSLWFIPIHSEELSKEEIDR